MERQARKSDGLGQRFRLERRDLWQPLADRQGNDGHELEWPSVLRVANGEVRSLLKGRLQRMGFRSAGCRFHPVDPRRQSPSPQRFPAARPNTAEAGTLMKSTPESSTQEVLAGLVERVTFHNAENGFCVLRAKARGHRDLVTVVGHAAIISAGEWITASGEWINDRTHGQQFKARFLKTSAPSSIDGIEKYLGSGMIRGIGPVYAKKMVKAFGDKVFDVIEAEPN